MNTTTTTLTQHRIIYALSSEGQALALRAGLDARAVQTIPIPAELLPRALDLGARIDGQGIATLMHGVETDHAGGNPKVAFSPAFYGAPLPRLAANAADALDLIAAAREASLVEIDARARKALALVVAGDDPHGYLAEEAQKGRLTQAEGERLAAAVAHKRAAQEVVERERVETTARAKIERAAKEAADAAAKRATLAHLAGLARDASQNAGERIDAGEAPLGLLSEEEARAIVRDAHLPPEGDYAKIERDEVCGASACDDDCTDECDDDEHHVVHFTSASPTSLNEDEWATAKVARAALKARGLEGELRKHVGSCSCDPGYASRLGIIVVKDLGHGIEVRREYAVGQ